MALWHKATHVCGAIGLMLLAGGSVSAEPTRVAKGMPVVDVLAAEAAIRDVWADYSLLIDGDGIANRRGEWAKLTFTKDYVWLWYDSNSKTKGPVFNLHEDPIPGLVQRPWKHLPITVKFDEVTPTTAKTRTTFVFLNVPKAKVEGQSDGVPVPGADAPGVPQAGMAVYHDTWRKEGDRWLKSATTVYSTNYGFFPFVPPEKK